MFLVWKADDQQKADILKKLESIDLTVKDIEESKPSVIITLQEHPETARRIQHIAEKAMMQVLKAS